MTSNPGPGQHTPKLLVIGGGPAGISAALQARELGAQVTLLEADQVGGTSLNRGPAPVRTLRRAARLVRDWSSWEQFGLRGPRPTLDLDAVLANSTRVAHYAHDKKDLAGLLRGLGIDLIEHLGPLRFTDAHTLRTGDGRSWRADRILVAVGGHAAPLPVSGGHLALGYDDLRSMKELPSEVMVVGGADTGCQIASIFEDFGASVRILEFAPTLLGAAEPVVSAALRAAFEAQGMHISTGTRVTELEADGDRQLHRPRVRRGRPLRTPGRPRPRHRHRHRPLRRSAATGRRRAHRRVLQAHRRPRQPPHPGRACTRRVLGRDRPGRRHRDVRRHDRRAPGRHAVRLPDLHRSRQHGRPEGLPRPRHRTLPDRLELPRRGTLKRGPAGRRRRLRKHEGPWSVA